MRIISAGFRVPISVKVRELYSGAGQDKVGHAHRPLFTLWMTLEGHSTFPHLCLDSTWHRYEADAELDQIT